MEGRGQGGLYGGVYPPPRRNLARDARGAGGAGIYNYTIWNVGHELFGYYECEKGVDFAAAYQANSPVVDRWNEYMKDILIMEMDPVTGAQPMLRKVFEME